MDDDGQKQRLLDVIGDPHALETFLENFPSSSFPTDGGLLWQGLDSPRFDNVTSSTDSGLVSSCLDNLVLDGQFLGQVRGGSHPLNHSQVPTHVLQQVLPSPTLPAAPQGAPHPQQQQQQHQHQQPQQPQQQPPQPPQPQQPPQPHQQVPHPQHQQHPHQQQQNVAIQSSGAPHVAGAPNTNGGDGSRENDPPTLQQLLASPAAFPSQPQPQGQLLSQPHHQANVGAVGHSLPPTILTTTASRLPSIPQAQQPQQQPQLPVQPSPRPVAVRPQISPATKNSQGSLPTTPQPPPQVISQAAAQATSQVISSGVQLVGGPNQVITSGGQIITSASPQLLQGTQLLQPPGSAQVMPTSQLLPGGQVLHNGQVLQGGQVLHGAHMLHGGQLIPGGPVIQGSQVLQGGQLIQGGQVINSSQLITTTAQMVSTGVSGLGGASAPLYVTPSSPAIQQQQQQQQQQQTHTVTLQQSGQPPTPAASPFSVPSKSPGTALPRTSPSPSSYHPTTPSPHPAVPSPVPYNTRSPAPSPHNNVSAMRSPAPPTPSPAATPTPQTHSSISQLPQQQPTAGVVPGVMGNVGMVQGLVPQLPPLSQVVGSNGMVLPQPGVQQATAGVKQVVSGGQLIQIVSSPQPTQPRQPLVTPSHKPIQPKQPQLLPKPPQQPVVGQPPPAPPGKALIGSRPVTPGTQQPIVIGAGGQQATTMVASQQGLGGFVINPSLLQSSLQQPLLIQQPNGVLLVRPSGHSGAGAPGQALLVPMPGQPQLVSAGAKASQPQTVVFPGSGQGGPAFVIPQNIAPGVIGAQGARGPQPIIRLVAPQAPLQLQQIQTPNGPTFVAVPAGQTVNLQGLIAAGGATMRTLAPQVASGPLQLAPSSVATANMAPVVSMGHIQMPGSGQQLHVSVPGAPLQLASSLPSSLPSVITTTKQTVIEENVAPASIVTAAEVGTHQTVSDPNKNTKKKSKKKKKEKEPKDEKLKNKGSSINLNDILKETGIMGDMMLFDENEIGLGSEGIEGGQTTTTPVAPAAVAQAVVTTAPASANIPRSESSTSFTPESTSHVVVGSSQTPTLVGMSSSIPTGTAVTSSTTSGLMTSVANVQGGMCFTLDPSGKVILGSDLAKPQLTLPSTPAVSQVGGLVIPTCQHQMQVIGGAGVGVSSVAGMGSGGGVVNVMNSGMPTVMAGTGGAGMIGANTLPTVGSLPSFTQLLTTPSQVTTNVVVHGPGGTSKTRPLQLQQAVPKVTQLPAKTQTGGDISQVAQNTHLLQTLHLPASEKTFTPGQPLLPSLLSGQQGLSSASGEQSSVPVQVSTDGGGSMLTVVSVGGVMSVPEGGVSTGTTFSSPAPLSILVPSQASQVPQSSAVIVSSSATNSVVSGAIISHKPFVTNSALIPQTSVTQTNSENVPMSQNHPQIVNTLLQDNVPSHTTNTGAFVTKNIESNSKPPSFQNEYVASLQKGQNLIDSSKNKSKSNKKKRKDKETDSIPPMTSNQIIGKQSLQERLKAGTTNSTSGTNQQSMPLSVLPNGLSGTSLKMPAHNMSNSTSQRTSLPAGEMVGLTENASTVASSLSTVTQPAAMVTVTSTITVTSQSQVTTTTSTVTSTSTAVQHTPGVVIGGQKPHIKQIKHLILSQHNQEALKKVHSQIQSLQNKKSEQDQACLQQLYAEYKKIMATGKHVTVTTTTQQPHIAPAPSQPTPVRYSHPVGHKIITFTPFKQQIKHLPQGQQRAEQNKQGLQRWKESIQTPSSSIVTSPGVQSTTTPHVSPSGQVAGSSGQSRVSASPVVGASMPTIATSVPSPTVPTTSTTVSSCTTSNSLSYSVKTTPPQCSPVPSATPPASHPIAPGPSPKALVTTSVVVQTPATAASSCVTVTMGTQDQHCQSQSKAPAPSPAFSITKDQLFEHQLKTDQNGALNPDYRNPFKNKIDACKRLIRYHVYSDHGPTPRDLAESDGQFEVQAESLLKKYNNMKYKYQSLLIKDSMRRHASSEMVMLYRMFVQEEKINIERDKNDVQNGKNLELPLAPQHWISGEAIPPDPPYPWELEWDDQKIYTFEPWIKDEDEEEVEEEEEAEEEKVKEEDREGEEVKVEVEEDKVVKEAATEEIKEEGKSEIEQEATQGELKEEKAELEEFDDGMEGDSQLQIFMEEEEEEQAKAEEEAKEDVPSAVSVNCSSKMSDLDVSSDRDSKQELEQEQELVICDSEVVCTSRQNSPVKSQASLLEYDTWTNSEANVLDRIPVHSQSPEMYQTQNDNAKKVKSPQYEESGKESFRQVHSPVSKIGADRTDKDKRKERTDRDRRKSDKVKERDKERGRDREKEDRPPKKLKIKLKSDDRAIVPPLRIRTEERGIGLKLTLKKQEGSGAYYSVGEERKREYRVEQNEEEEEEEEEQLEEIPRRPFEEEEEEEEEEDGDQEGHGLKEVKVVLQDVLKDKRYKKQIEERSSKKRRRERSDNRGEGGDRGERADRNERGERHDRIDKNDWCDRNNSVWTIHSHHQSEGEENSLQHANHENRTWNHNSGVEWRRSEGASSIENLSDHRTSRDYSPRLQPLNDHYGQEYSSRHNHSQPYGHSGSQPRNSHNYY